MSGLDLCNGILRLDNHLTDCSPLIIDLLHLVLRQSLCHCVLVDDIQPKCLAHQIRVLHQIQVSRFLVPRVNRLCFEAWPSMHVHYILLSRIVVLWWHGYDLRSVRYDLPLLQDHIGL